MYREFHISGLADCLQIKGEVEQSVKLGSNGFFSRLLYLPKPRCVDFLRMAAGIYTVDRICKRRKERGNHYGVRDLKLTFVVEDLGFWRQPEIGSSLVEILYFLTGDSWVVVFEAAERVADDPGYQSYLPLPGSNTVKRAGLFSDGLDSASGLANRFLGGANNFLLITVGHRRDLHLRTQRQLQELNRILETVGVKESAYWHSTLTVFLEGGKAKRIGSQEKTQRCRAFLFCAAAATAASAYDIEVVEMFENGVGAINLPLMSGMLANGLATRGSHPVFLKLMSELSARVTGKPIRFELPFEHKTKAEMVKPLGAIEGLAKWAQASRSCVHTSIRVAGKNHCGSCPACIERRQAFHVAGVPEDVGIYQTDIFSKAMENEDAHYYNLYRLEAMDWLNGKERSKQRMADHLCLTGVSRRQDKKIIELQVRHSGEVFDVFGSPF